MASVKESVVFFVLMAAALLMHVAMANNKKDGKVYKVGDSAGWVINHDYAQWSSSKNFTVGDSIQFVYDKAQHNVIVVNEEEYKSCKLVNGSKHDELDSGNDIIKFSKNGHYYYICGVPHHCEGGQKLFVRVVNPSKDAADSPSPSSKSPPPSASHDDGAAPAPAPASTHHNSAAGSVSSSWNVFGVAATSFVAAFVGGLAY